MPASPPGDRVLRALRSHGVDPTVVRSDGGRQGLYYFESGGEPRGANVVYDRRDAAVTTATVDELPTDPFRTADAAFTSGITPALSGTLADTTGELLELAAESGATVGMDVNYRSKLWSPAEARETLGDLFDYLDVLVCARRDAATVLERDGDPAAVARGIANDHDVETVVITLGEDGALAVHDGTVREQSAVPTDTVDPVGSGDAFVGGFLARWLRDDSLSRALACGTATAAVARTLSGDAPAIDRDEVAAVLADEADRIDR